MTSALRQRVCALLLVLLGLAALCAAQDGAAGAEPAAPAAQPALQVQPAQDDRQRVEVISDSAATREMWWHDGGYCGETATQFVLNYYGIWASQYLIRYSLGARFDRRAGRTGMLLVTGADGVEGVLRKVGLYQDKGMVWGEEVHDALDTSALPAHKQFMVWVKRQLIGGNPVIVGHRINDDPGDVDYDHIVPYTAVEYSRRTRNSYDDSDEFWWQDDDNNLVHRSLDAGFFSARRGYCPVRERASIGGCVNSNPANANYGVAVRGGNPYNAPPGLYLPVRLAVTDWAGSGASAFKEPCPDRKSVV